jgi:NTP pyrophosphatase (non-canonical NTP hydrolase)
MDNRIKYIADYYGFTSQADMLIEESAEFIQAVSKFRRGNENEYAHIKEELADVLVCAEQLKYLLGASNIENIINAKLDRQLQRIEKEKQAEMNRIFP